MKSSLLILFYFFTGSILLAITIENSMFKASVSQAVLPASDRSLLISSSIVLGQLKIESIDFLGFDVENEDILDTFFSLESPEIVISETNTSLIIGEFKVAPSPVTNIETSYFSYRLGIDKDVSILIYNRRGQLMDSIEIESGISTGGSAGHQTVPLDSIDNFSAGIYFAFLKVGDELKRTKFEVQP